MLTWHYYRLEKVLIVRPRLSGITKHICTQNYIYMLTIQTSDKIINWILYNTPYACSEYIFIRLLWCDLWWRLAWSKGTRWLITLLSTSVWSTFRPAFFGIDSSLASPWLTVLSPDKQDKEGLNILGAWLVGSSGCKHTKGSIPFGAWLGLNCQATNIFSMVALNCTVLQ